MAYKSIRIRILGREYPLRIRDEDETSTLNIAAYVNEKMEAFKEAHPEQPELTTAIITALAIAEELYGTWEAEDQDDATLSATLDLMSDELEAALPPPAAKKASGSNGQAKDE